MCRAYDLDTLLMSVKEGAEKVFVDWRITVLELSDFSFYLASNATLRSVSFSFPIPHGALNDLQIALRRNILVEEVVLADGDRHARAVASILRPSEGEIAALRPLVRGLNLARPSLNTASQNRRVLLAAVSQALAEDPDVYPEAVLTTLMTVFKGERYDTRNLYYVQSLLESAIVPERVKSAIRFYLEDSADPFAAMVFEELLRAAAGRAQDSQNIVFVACQVGVAGVLREMVRAGTVSANVVVGDRGDTPLNLSCHNGHVSVARALLDAGADKHQPDSDGWAPLATAIYSDHLGVTKVLLAAGVDVERTLRDGRSPLHVAAQVGRTLHAEALLQAGAEKDRVKAGGVTPLFLACQEGHEDVVRLLLRAGVDKDRPTDAGWTPLHVASQSGRADIVELLLEAGAARDPTVNGDTPLNLASGSGHRDVVVLLLRAGADKNRADVSGWTPLHIAVQDGREDCVEALLEAGADVGPMTADGRLPLHLASQKGHVGIFEMLLRCGADKRTATRDGWAPIHLASFEGQVGILEVLLAAGEDKDAALDTGSTILLIASQEGHSDVVELLLKAGADKDRAEVDGCTPLFMAAQDGHKEVVELLIAAGADLNKAENDGETPAFIAFQQNHNEIVELLVQAGADWNKTLLFTYFPANVVTPDTLILLICQNFDFLPGPPSPALTAKLQHSAIHCSAGFLRKRSVARPTLERLVVVVTAYLSSHPTFQLFAQEFAAFSPIARD
jgi:ankyrin repeat protein